MAKKTIKRKKVSAPASTPLVESPYYAYTALRYPNNPEKGIQAHLQTPVTNNTSSVTPVYKKVNYANIKDKGQIIDTAIDQILGAETDENKRKQLETLLRMTNYMENKYGASDAAWNNKKVNLGFVELDKVAINDLFTPKGDKGNFTKGQKNNFEYLKNFGLPTNQKDLEKLLLDNDPLANMAVSRLVYATNPKALPKTDNANDVFNYWLENYNHKGALKNQNQEDLFKIFQEGYKKYNDPSYKPNIYVDSEGHAIIDDNLGQWAHPGEVTRIASNNITMQGVPYPVLGVGADGEQRMMYPNEEHIFNEAPVTEYPMMQAKDGGWINKYAEGGKVSKEELEYLQSIAAEDFASNPRNAEIERQKQELQSRTKQQEQSIDKEQAKRMLLQKLKEYSGNNAEEDDDYFYHSETTTPKQVVKDNYIYVNPGDKVTRTSIQGEMPRKPVNAVDDGIFLAFADAIQEYKERYPDKPLPRISSGLRTREEQERLYANRGSNRYPVAKPGTSKHELGQALDIVFDNGGSDEDYQRLANLMSPRGFKWLGDYDKVHFEVDPNYPKTYVSDEGNVLMTGQMPSTSLDVTRPKPRAFQDGGEWQPNQEDLRADGTQKGTGYLGVLNRPDGGVSSELSMGVEIDGQEVEIPTMVPTLNPEEINYLLNTPADEDLMRTEIGRRIMDKAYNHAMMRMDQGLSPFYQEGEERQDTGVPRAQNIFNTEYKRGGVTWLNEYAQGGEIFSSGGEKHRVYKKESPTGNGKGVKGHIMVTHPTMDKGKWDTIDLTEKSGAKTIAQGVVATRKWHRENPEYQQGGPTTRYSYVLDDDSGNTVFDDNGNPIIINPTTNYTVPEWLPQVNITAPRLPKPGGIPTSNVSQSNGSLAADLVLDAAQFVPGPLGVAASAVGVGKNLYEGDYVGAGLDLANIATLGGAKWFTLAADLAKAAGKVNKGNRLAKQAKLLEHASNPNLWRTTGLTRDLLKVDKTGYTPTYKNEPKKAPNLISKKDGGWLNNYK